MPPKVNTKKSIKNSSLVPVLFTLGVIGWGFFAIDRLTSSGNPAYADYTAESHDYAQDSDKNKKTWKKSAEEFIGKFTSSAKVKSSVKEENDPESENWTVVNEDNAVDKSPEKGIPDVKPGNTDGIVKNDIDQNVYFLYFYQENKGHLKLSEIPRKKSGSLNLKNIFQEIVAGPSFLRDHKHLIDSFPVKPTVIDAWFKNSILVINLDDNFGHGISFETAGLQLEQIMKTSSQFKNIHSVQFLINGEEVESIHVDGLTIPANLKTGRPVALSKSQEN